MELLKKSESTKFSKCNAANAKDPTLDFHRENERKLYVRWFCLMVGLREGEGENEKCLSFPAEHARYFYCPARMLIHPASRLASPLSTGSFMNVSVKNFIFARVSQFSA